jgi:cytochrome c553
MMNSLLAAALVLSGAVFAAAPAFAEGAGNPEDGRKVARMCSACHGRDGVAVRPHTPNIAGLDPEYIAEQLAHFRSAERVHPEMNVVASGLSDQQIADLSAWFGSQTAPAE